MTSGYSLRRNNSCHASESELNCGKTWDTMHRCCPFGTNCGEHDCRTTNRPPEEKRCANSTWSLYFAKGFFCCDADQMAFQWIKGGRDGWVGCAHKGFVLDDSQTSLAAIVEGSASTSPTATGSVSLSTTLSSPTTGSAGTVTSSPSDSESSSNETNTGAIAGGVVGGVAGVVIIGILVWLVMRRRTRALQSADDTVPTSEFYAGKGPVPVSELNHNERRFELDDQPGKAPLHELPAQ